MTTKMIKRNNGRATVPSANISSWVDQMIQNSINRFFHDDFWNFPGTEQVSAVPVNLRETEKTFEMELVAPGLRKEDFKLQVSDHLLTVSFDKKEEEDLEDKSEGWLRKEYRLQSFSRSFNLDDSVDLNRISAVYNNGILQLTLPKKENAQWVSKTIEVK